MWSRIMLKENAKQVLQQNYWMAFAVCAIFTIIAGIGTSSITGKIIVVHNDMLRIWYSGHSFFDFSRFLSQFALAGLLALAFSVGLTLFLINPLEAGVSRYFMLSRDYCSDLGSMFSSFSSGRYLNIVKVLFFRGLFVLLWSLLFIVPGIVKAYQYRMVPYLMAENPDMDYHRALDLSRAMTRGHKWDLFVLDLSFLGWWLIGAMLCGVGTLFVIPYVQATNAEVYEFMRQKAFATGLAGSVELPGFYPRTGGFRV